MYRMKVKFTKMHPCATIPDYEHDSDSGFDFIAVQPFHVNFGKIVMVRTGLAVEMPNIPLGMTGHQTVPFNITMELQIRAKSGLAANYGIALANGIGTVDFGYRGEILVPLTKLTPGRYDFVPGQKFAQGVFAPVFSERAFDFVEVDTDELSETLRDDGGFGSTGK